MKTGGLDEGVSRAGSVEGSVPGLFQLRGMLGNLRAPLLIDTSLQSLPLSPCMCVCACVYACVCLYVCTIFSLLIRTPAPAWPHLTLITSVRTLSPLSHPQRHHGKDTDITCWGLSWPDNTVYGAPYPKMVSWKHLLAASRRPPKDHPNFPM